MSGPSTLRIERPYSSLDAYLEGDAWTVERSDMVLVGAEAVAPGTAVKFEIVLTTGAAVVKGEGRVVEAVGAKDGRPAGMRVRFRQLDGASKATLKRALEVQKRTAGAREKSSPNASSPEATSSPMAAPEPVVVPIVATVPTEALPSVHETAPEPPPRRAEPSGIRHRVAAPVSAPNNREELLSRLRDRRAAASRGTAAE